LKEINMIAAIIVAAGKGIRMQDSLRKQYLPLAGLPIIVSGRTAGRFRLLPRQRSCSE